MTSIEYVKEIGKDYTSFEISIKGHSNAERNTQNNDLCCCACSVLGCTLLGALNNSFQNCKGKGEEGNINISLCIKKDPKEADKANTIIESFFYGFEQTEKHYPKNVSINRKIIYKKN